MDIKNRIKPNHQTVIGPVIDFKVGRFYSVEEVF
jgi:hypothetical protein